jgi:hypothetical protein
MNASNANPTPVAVVDDVEPAPCADCYLARRCGAKLLACNQFIEYTHRGRWSTGPRTPTRAVYRLAFADDVDREATASVGDKPRRTKATSRSRSEYVQRALAGLSDEAAA